MSSLPKALKICIFTTNPAGIYSGGRYMSMMLAYALARAQADVTYISNIAPIFDADFDVYQTPEADCAAVTKIIGPGFGAPPGYRADWVIVIPTGSFDEKFYDAALTQARQWQARVALISFETPNWFAATSPYARSALPTESWRRVVAQGGLVVTIARTGVPYARAYYGPARTDLRFGYWHPPVNDLMAAIAANDTDPMAAIAASDTDPMAAVAASAADPASPRRIVCFIRTEDRHKGAQDLLALPPDLFEGHILALVFGRGVNEAYVTALRRHFAPVNGGPRDFAVEVHSQISDHAKFALLARSRLLLFPSYFEGYGYPPVEAAWMGVPSVVYDLPVLRETLGAPGGEPGGEPGGAATYVPPGDTVAFGAAIRVALRHDHPGPAPRASLRASLCIAADTRAAGQAFLDLLDRVHSGVAPIGPPPAARPILPRPQVLADPAVQPFVAAHGPGLQLSGLTARATIGADGGPGCRIRISGTVRGTRSGDLIRCDMAGALVPDAPLLLQPDQPGGAAGNGAGNGAGARAGTAGAWPFALEGVIETLDPRSSAPAPTCTVRLIRPARMTARPNGPVQAPEQAADPATQTTLLAVTTPVRLDPAVLFDRALWSCGAVIRPAVPPAATRAAEVLLLVDLVHLEDSQTALALSEVCALLYLQGRPSRMLLPPQDDFTAGDPEILPLVDALERLDRQGRADRAAQALAKGQRIVLLDDLLAQDLVGPGAATVAATVLAHIQPEGAASPVLVLGPRVPKHELQRLVAAPDPQLARRSLFAGSQRKLVVLLTGWTGGPPPALVTLLARLEARLGGLRVVVPGRLVRAGGGYGMQGQGPHGQTEHGPLTFGHGGVIERLGEVALAAALTHAGPAVGLAFAEPLSGRAPDPATLALLAGFDLPVVPYPDPPNPDQPDPDQPDPDQPEPDLSAAAAVALTRLRAALQPEMQWGLDRGSHLGGPVGAAIAALFGRVGPADPEPDALPVFAGAMLSGRSAARPGPVFEPDSPAQTLARPGPFPVLRQGGVLSFSLPGVGDAAALVSGWTALGPGGAILDGPHPEAALKQAGVKQPLAVLCFGRNDDIAPGSGPGSDAGPLMLELLIRTQVSASAPLPAGGKPAAPPVPVNPCVLGVSLNGHDLGEIRPFGVAPGAGGGKSGAARSGVVGSRFKVPAALWQPQDPQVLVLDWRQPATDPGHAVTLALVAVALSPLPPVQPDWATSAAVSAAASAVELPLAPLLRYATPPIRSDPPGAALAVSFRAFAPPGFATRGRGWSLPETAGTWSTGAAAVIQFAAAFVASTPALLSLTGHSLPVDPTAAQRIGLASGADHLATLVIPAAAGSTADLALPGSLLAGGIDHLLLQFPDAASPRDLGMNEDDRRLGLHLGGFTLRRTGRRVFAHQGAPDTLPDRILACPGVLRLSGTRPRSKPGAGLQLHLSGQPVFAAVFAQAADGPGEQRWECCLPLTPALVAEGALFVHLLTDEGRGPPAQPPAQPPVIDTVEVWAEQDQPLTEMSLVPAQVPLPAATDLRRWLAASHAGHAAKLHNLPLRLPQQMRFGAGLADLTLLGTGLGAGWSAPEPDQVWTDGPEAVLHLGGALHPADHLLTLTAGALITPGHSCQRSLLRLGGQPVASLLLRSGDSAAHQIVVPAELISAAPGPATLQVDLPDAISPAALGLSTDSRMLGLRLQGLALERLPPGPVTKTGAGIAWADSAGPDSAGPDSAGPDSAGPDPALSDWTLQLLGAGAVIAVAGTGAPPFGLSLQGSAVVAHPVRPGAGLAAGWRVLLHLPPEPVSTPVSTSARHLLLIHHQAADGQIDPDRHAPGPTLVITA